MKLTICQIGKLFLLLTAFFFLLNSHITGLDAAVNKLEWNNLKAPQFEVTTTTTTTTTAVQTATTTAAATATAIVSEAQNQEITTATKQAATTQTQSATAKATTRATTTTTTTPTTQTNVTKTTIPKDASTATAALTSASWYAAAAAAASSAAVVVDKFSTNSILKTRQAAAPTTATTATATTTTPTNTTTNTTLTTILNNDITNTTTATANKTTAQQHHQQQEQQEQEQEEQEEQQPQQQQRTVAHKQKPPRQKRQQISDATPITAKTAPTTTTTTTPTTTATPTQRIQRKAQQHQQQEQKQEQEEKATSSQPTDEKQHRVGVVLPAAYLDKMHVQQGFEYFAEFFQVPLKNVHVDFLPDDDDDLSGFIKLLEQPKYTTIVKTLNGGINVDDGNNDSNDDDGDDDDHDDDVHNDNERSSNVKVGVDIDVHNVHDDDDDEGNNNGDGNVDLTEGVSFQVPTATIAAKAIDKQPNGKLKQASTPTATTATTTLAITRKAKTHKLSNIGHCHLAEELARDYNKNVLLWPCPHMKESSNFLPSFEAISFAVKSIATKLNWTQVDIFVGDENWALPLAIAANLQIPCRIEIGDTVRDPHAMDKPGQAIIITAPMNDDTTLRLLNSLATSTAATTHTTAKYNNNNNNNQKNNNNNGKWQEQLQHAKILLIDIVATSFNAQNRFYKDLAHIDASSGLMSNLLLLTVLSDKYRHFLNVAFDHNGIKMVQNFRQESQQQQQQQQEEQQPQPIHLASDVLPTHVSMLDDALRACPPAQNQTVEEICRNVAAIAQTCAQLTRVQHPLVTHNQTLAPLLVALCQQHDIRNGINSSSSSSSHSSSSNSHSSNNTQPNSRQQIENLRNFIDFFNFYDFLIANVIGIEAKAERTASSHYSRDNKSVTHVPKYDFIVLEVVRDEVVISAGEYGPQTVGKGSATTTAAGSSSSNASRANKNERRVSNTFKWRPLLILERHEINTNTYISHSIQPGYDDWLLMSGVQLTHCGAICWTIVVICVSALIIIVVASVAAVIAMRNYFLRKRLSKGPNKIVLSANDFVFPVDSRRVDEGIEAMLCCWLQQLQEFGGPEVDKPDLLKGSIGSLKNLGFVIPGGTTATTAAGATSTTTATANGKSTSATGSLARHNPALLDMRARYNGDLVQLKEIHMNGSTELKTKAMDLLIMAHGLRHENMNPLIGWLCDPNRTAMVFDYCSRGSLQDVLIMDEIKLDWSFRLSLLTDLVRGMRYLHTSPLRVHGTLTSRNCVVDARWVLKITDYGLNSFYEAQGLAPLPRSAKELLWTAPELLRVMKPHHHHHPRVLGTQMGDVYSFGIIMQEVVVRGEPYCMLSLSPEEIITKIKKPPPLIRPSVSKGAAPPEAINIMRQCWAEQPEMRPDFNSVYERFKMLNHGRKVNFVDTMFQMLEKYSNNLEELIRERTEQLDIERKKTEQLLNRMLPSSVAEKLKMGLAVDPEEFADVTIYFSDIVGFTTIAAHCSPVQVVDLLNDLYTIFDATINAYNVYKVETIGDAYMVVSGLPVKIPDHAEQIATMALDLLHQSGRFNVKHLPGVPLQLRIGLHTGPCCAGVVGLTMPRYCLFGDTVNTASRMESTGSSWRIHMSQETRDRLEVRGGYAIEQRGLIEIKGKGLMNTFWLLGKKGFDKLLPTPPPIGLDESLIRNSITLKAQANKSRTSTNPSSSQSSSLAGESVEVKVEITPPTNVEICSTNLPNSYSLDSNSTNTISPNMTLCPEFPTKTPNASPQSRKMSELSPDNLLNPNTFNRLPSSTSGSSSRLYKKIEEMMDLSSPYNHYKCLSPSESNLTQFYDGKYLYSNTGGTNSGGGGSGGTSMHGSTAKFDSKPGSSRLLRRQFSLDRDDTQTKPDLHHQQHHQNSLQANYAVAISAKSSMLDIPVLHDTSRSPKGTLTRAHKQNSTSITQDLEKIEEIPLSPASSQHHSSLDSNLNRSPPSTVGEGQSPPRQSHELTRTTTLMSSTPPMLSAPTSPAPSRSLNGIRFNATIPAITESPTTTDASTATTTASVNSNNTTPGETSEPSNRNPELTLNVASLLSR